jgi:hypothetical protein
MERTAGRGIGVTLVPNTLSPLETALIYGRNIRETLRIDNSRLRRPDDAHHGRHRLALDKLNLDLVVVDLAGRQRGDGMIWALGELLDA